MSCESRCVDSCGSSTCHDGDSNCPDVEDLFKAEVTKLQAQVKELQIELEKQKKPFPPLRSSDWFGRTDDLGMVALYAERYLNYGLTKDELLTGKPIIGIAQSGSDLTPCNRHHLELAKRVRDGVRAAGGIPLEFPMHPIQESVRRPTAALDRNLAYLGLVEILHAYPLDGVVFLTGCDKTTPACLMAAATVDLPGLCLNVGPMLNGWDRKGERVGSGSVVWQARQLHAAGKISQHQFLDMVMAGTPSPGHCNTMGTASTMNAVCEALGMALPGTAAIPAVYRERSQAAYETGLRVVELVRDGLRPSHILKREAFENAIVVTAAIGGSTNAAVHLNAIAKHSGVELDLEDWYHVGYAVPLLVNLQPAGKLLGEDFHRAGGVAAVMAELMTAEKLPHPEAMTVSGRNVRENLEGRRSGDHDVIRPFHDALIPNAGFLHLRGNLFSSAVMKTSVISDAFRAAFLSNPTDPNAFEGPVAVFDGPEDYHAKLDRDHIDATITNNTILVMRGVGPRGYPGAAEVVNMHPPGRLLRGCDGAEVAARGLPCIGDGRQSGTSGSPSILHADPEAAAGGNLALLRDGDRVRVDLVKRLVTVLVSDEELAERRADLEARGGYTVCESMTPWQDMCRRQGEVSGLSEGMVLNSAVKFQRIVQKFPVPRDNH